MKTTESDSLEVRLRHGDERALTALFDEHRQRLQRTVQFRIGPSLRARIDPDDVLQEAFLAARQRIAHYAQQTGISPFIWLRAIVTQTLIDLHRHHVGAQMRGTGREISLQAMASPQDTTASIVFQMTGHLTSPTQAAARSEMVQRIERAMNTMEPIDREVLALRHFEELTNSETAEALGIEPKAASIRYIRAIARLKAILSDLPGYSREGQP